MKKMIGENRICSTLCRKDSSSGHYVQYGCGFSSVEGWINFDSSLTLRWERLPIIGKFYTKNQTRFPPGVMYGDIVRGLPVEEDSCAGIFASHVIEHLTLDDARTALRNTYRYLKRDGFFRVVVPDMAVLIQNYLLAAAAGDDSALHVLMEQSCLGSKSSPKGFWGRIVEVFGNSRHLWMWDYNSMAIELNRIGFINIRRCTYGDCHDQNFRLVESPARFRDALAMECSKAA